MRINKNLLKKTAMKSSREQRHSSIIFIHGTPIKFGYNSSHKHAEENAIGEGDRYTDNLFSPWRGAIMVNLRLTRSGKIGLAKPCPACFALLKEKKFRKVIYSTNEGTFQEIYL